MSLWFSYGFLIYQYMSNMESWCKACGEGDLPSELQDLEDTIHHHQGLYEHINAAYSEVCPSCPLYIENLPTYRLSHHYMRLIFT